ncbi:hypothetical protein LOD99_8475 [Oopsacas minuta]|uniref:Ubiquitin-like domain-containing protein n=1 Tax=Oopsacas minuta TaxID=111878 RepID=A0AAV7JGT8_9METZ|nr:hypothetical protein LOD99_8475 [Oopsacas minuta]
MNTIFVIGLSNKTYSFVIPKKGFQDYTVSKLRCEVAIKCGIQEEHQRLLYVGKELQNIRQEKKMTIVDYGISDQCTIMLVTRLPGGYNRKYY